MAASPSGELGLDHGDDYAWEALIFPDLLDPAMSMGADFRAIVHGVSPDQDELDIIRNAPLPTGGHDAYLQLWRRGAEEICTWLTGGAGPLVQLTTTAWGSP